MFFLATCRRRRATRSARTRAVTPASCASSTTTRSRSRSTTATACSCRSATCARTRTSACCSSTSSTRTACASTASRRVDEHDPLLAEMAGATLVVRVRTTQVFPNCSRYIHKMQMVERSQFVPRAEGDATRSRTGSACRGRRTSCPPAIRPARPSPSPEAGSRRRRRRGRTTSDGSRARKRSGRRAAAGGPTDRRPEPAASVRGATDWCGLLPDSLAGFGRMSRSCPVSSGRMDHQDAHGSSTRRRPAPARASRDHSGRPGRAAARADSGCPRVEGVLDRAERRRSRPG